MAKGDARKAVKAGPLRRVLDAATGAKLCFGEPVTHGDRTVIPVARVQGAGGYGFGRGGDPGGDGGGGGGWLEAKPVGFVEITAAGTSFQKIPEPDRFARILRVGASSGATLAAAFAGARSIQRRRARRSPAGLLRRG